MRATRRAFMQLAAGVGAGHLVGGLAGAGHAQRVEGKRMFANGKLGLGLVTYLMGEHWDLPTLIAMCEKTRMDAVELRTTHAHGVEIALTAAQRAEVRARFADTPVVLAGLGSTCEYHSPDPAVVRRNIEETRAFCELARDVGALGVKVRPNALPDGVPVERTLGQIAEALRECGNIASDCGVRLFVEVHGPGTSDPGHMRTIMEACSHPSVGVTWNCNGTDLVDGSIAETFPLLRRWVSMVHTHDWYEAYPYKEELIPFLLEMDFDGYCLAEMPGSPDAERVLRYYRRLFDELVLACS